MGGVLEQGHDLGLKVAGQEVISNRMRFFSVSCQQLDLAEQLEMVEHRRTPKRVNLRNRHVSDIDAFNLYESTDLVTPS